jgi:hypothetical protein
MGMTKSRLLTVTAACVSLTACASVQRVPLISKDLEFDVPASRAQVFDKALATALSLNLAVDVMEKSSGFIQFKNASLSANQLDLYAEYGYVKTGTTEPVGSFASWSQTSSSFGGGPVTSSVSLSLLLTETSTGTHVKLHTVFVASNRVESNQQNSKGVLEANFERALRELRPQ